MQPDSHAFPLSFAQQRLWFLDRMAPGNPFYNIPLAVPIASSIDVRTLERALNAILDRHEALRTIFRVIDGEPRQIVLPSCALKITVTDLRQLSPAERDARTTTLATDEARKPFDLEQGPLVRCSLITRGAFDHVLLLTLHHIISDGWSMGILAQELTAFYQSFATGSRAPLPELPIQYPDFAMWQRELLQGPELERLLSYWRKQLADLPLLDLPADRARPPMTTFQGDSHPIVIPPALSSAVRRFAQQHHATPFMVLLAAFAALLHRYAGQDDVVIGTPVANRNRGEIEGLIGFFVNSLVLRVSAEGDPGFAEFVSRTREVALEAYAHQDLPFEKLVEELHPVRDLSRNPLFQVTFQLVDIPTLEQATKSGASGNSAIHVQRGSAIFDIAFTLMESPAGFHGILEYSTDIFDGPTIARMDRHLQQLLRAAVEHPQIPLSALPLADEEERASLIALAKGPIAPEPETPFVHRAIARQAERTPDAVAVQSETAQLTYAELVRDARRLARRLRAAGVGCETRVGILMDRSTELVTTLLGVLEAGGVYVPLDPTYPVERLRFMLTDSAAPIIVTHAVHENLAATLAGEQTVVISLDDPEHPEPGETEEATLSPENLAYLLYTSGSTGRPKGIAIPHRALANHMQWMLERFPLDANDTVLQRTPYGFDASVWEFYAPLMSGARLVALSPEGHRNPEIMVDAIARHGVTVVQFVPALLRLLLDEPALYTCFTLRRIFCGGEALSDELREKVVNALGVELVNLYGPTETTIDATYYVAGEAPEPFGVPIGAPVSNMRAYVLDPHLELVPTGMYGELYLAGDGVARGYIDRPGMTAERFLPDPFSDVPGARMYRSGDRVRRRGDGMLLFAGRADEQVKVRGFRVELAEIEALIRRVPGIDNCAVVAETNGNEATALTAFLVPDHAEVEAGAARDIEQEQVARWGEVYEQVYGALDDEDPAFNTIGWNSSYTGQPLPAAEMAEWRDNTLARILALEPSRVLEIGCGAGLLLTQIAPRCRQYVATDFSAPVIRYLRSHIDAPNVTLLQREAADFTDLPPAAFDVVILNSVAQYFPDADYFAKVLRGVVAAVAPGGAIYIGDLRSLPLLDAFHFSVASYRSATDAEDLLARARLGAEQEEELVIDPRFFTAFAKEVDGITSVEVSLKRGLSANELTRFRYDVVLRVHEPRRATPYQRIEWNGELPSSISSALVIEGIPNARVAADARMLELLRASGGKAAIQELHQQAEEETRSAVDAEELWSAAEKLGYRVRLRFSAPPRIDCFDAVLQRGGDAISDLSPFGAFDGDACALANNPLRGAMSRRLATRGRDAVATELPEYMVPSAFVLIDELPLMPNGKLNRAALARLRVVRSETSDAYTAPRTPLEDALAVLWAEVLAVPRVGIRDDFFTRLGGHSLLATRLISRIRSAFRIEVPLKTIFEAPTVERFARALTDQVSADENELDAAAGLIVKLSRMTETELDEGLQLRKA